MSELQFIETSAQKVHETVISELENGVNDPLYPATSAGSSATPWLR